MMKITDYDIKKMFFNHWDKNTVGIHELLSNNLLFDNFNNFIKSFTNDYFREYFDEIKYIYLNEINKKLSGDYEIEYEFDNSNSYKSWLKVFNCKIKK